MALLGFAVGCVAENARIRRERPAHGIYWRNPAPLTLDDRAALGREVRAHFSRAGVFL